MTRHSIDDLLRLLPEPAAPDPAFAAQLRERLSAELRGEAAAGEPQAGPSTDMEVLDLEVTTASTLVTRKTGAVWLRVAGAAAAVVLVAAAVMALTGTDDATTTVSAPDATFVGATLEISAIDSVPDDPYFVSAAGDAWVLSLGGDVLRVDAQTGAAARVATVSEASLLAVDAEAVWIADAVAGTVLRLDPEDGSVVAEIDTGIEVVPTTFRIPMREGASRRFALIGGIASDGATVWVGDRAGRVLRIDPATNEVSGSFEVPVRPDQLQIAGDHLLVSNLTGGEVAVVDAADGELVRQTGLDELAGAALHDGALYVQSSADGTVTRIDLETGEERTSEPLGASVVLTGQPVLPTGLVVTAAGVLVDTGTRPASLHVLDPETLVERGTLATEVDHGDMAVAPDGSVWLVRANAHRVVHITPRPV